MQQTIITLPPFAQGSHLITQEVEKALAKMTPVEHGLLHLFLQHTSAGLSINENSDRNVRRDLDYALDHIVPEDLDYHHTEEGSDDMPAHIKSSLVGVSLNIPVAKGKLLLGTWQGIYLCEFRRQGGARKIVLTLSGE